MTSGGPVDNNSGGGGVLVAVDGGSDHDGVVDSAATPLPYDHTVDHSQRMSSHLIRHEHSPLRYIHNYPTQEMANSAAVDVQQQQQTTGNSGSGQNSRRGRGRTVSGKILFSIWKNVFICQE